MAWRAPGGQAAPIAAEGEFHQLPTAVFFNAEDRSIHFGREAISLYLAGVDGRLMRSLKSLLGTSLLEEQTRVPEGMVSFRDVIARFLREMRLRAGRQLGTEVKRVVLGRPVHFVDGDPARDQRAQEALATAAQQAGFDDVTLELEPIAAAFDYEQRIDREKLVLIVDIGGGTSDFTVVRLGPERARRTDREEDVLATRGVHIGGTDYDRRLSLERVMPLFGFRHRGLDGREVPSGVFFDLATWHLINWLYTPKALRGAEDLRANYAEPVLHVRLMEVLRERLGHRIAADVEAAKIRTSGTEDAVSVDLGAVEAGLLARFSRAEVDADLSQLLDEVVRCGQECAAAAGVSAGKLDCVYLTGGSSALPAFQQRLANAFPDAQRVVGDLFGGVAAGLACAAAR
ncbi:MAG: Hsp70 family protein [Burkholderiales bacterium]|nr:Hsp70 family protein [Burkholderiales bacterium]